jgi:hypothetical protein
MGDKKALKTSFHSGKKKRRARAGKQKVGRNNRTRKTSKEPSEEERRLPYTSPI